MAYIINEYPSSISYARSPILYMVVDDVNYTQSKFQYIAEVWLWQGAEGDKPIEPEYELRKPPNTQYGNAVFNIQSLSTDWLITPEFDIDNNISKTSEFYVWAQVSFGYIYVDTNGDTIKVIGEQIAPAITVFNGYNYYMEGLNYARTSHFGTEATNVFQQRVLTDGGIVEAISCIPESLLDPTGNGFWLTDKPTALCIPSKTDMYMFAINDYPNALVDRVVVDVVTESGTYSQAWLLQFYPTKKVLAVGCGTANIEVLFPEATYGKLISYNVYGAGISGSPVTFVYEFTICEPCKYGFKNMQFLNRYGVWDNIIFYGTQRHSMNVERSEILHSPIEIHEGAPSDLSFYFNKPYGQFHDTAIHGRETLTMNTGWIGEAWNEVIKQMLLTQFLYDADSRMPFTQDTKQMAFKTSLNDGLINYTMVFKGSFTSINTIT